MDRRFIYVGLLVLVVGFFVVVLVMKPAQSARPGTQQTDHGGGHSNTSTYGGDEPPTSGEHANTLAKGIYKEEIADVNVLHNLEHGGVYISYRPDISKEDIKKIEQLFSVPSSREKFNPAKAVVAPRSANKANIVISSWNRSETFTTFDEMALYEYYVLNFNKSPEPFGK